MVSRREPVWAGRDGRNAISDAELLLCLLRPQKELPAIRFDRPDRTARDVLAALSPFGDAMGIPRHVVRLIGEYLDRYVDSGTGAPVFPAGSYLVTADPADQRQPTAEQQALDTVEAYAISIVLTLAVIEFVRNYRSDIQRQDPSAVAELGEIEAAAGRRLTAAMVGLRRSFTVNIFSTDSPAGRILHRTIGRRDDPDPAVTAQLRHELRDVITGLHELDLPDAQVRSDAPGAEPPARADQDQSPAAARLADLAGNRDLLFECGWSWGVVRGAPPVDTTGLDTPQPPGSAEPAPYLYFTLVAVDAIGELFHERTGMRALLDIEQQRLARTLRLEWEFARKYWSTVATFGTGDRWPLEEIPWQTTDGDETLYYSLMVTALVVEQLLDQHAPDTDLARVTAILDKLADRSRITSRALAGDAALELHVPGRRIALVGTEDAGPDAPRLAWLLADVATLLLQRVLEVAGTTNDSRLRARVLEFADQTWTHVQRRRLASGRAAGLWDQPANVYPSLERRDEIPSWYSTMRVVAAFAEAVKVINRVPPPARDLVEITEQLLIEAELLYDRELLRGSDAGGPSLRDTLRAQATSLRRARAILRRQPATAFARACEVLQELDRLSAARESEPGD